MYCPAEIDLDHIPSWLVLWSFQKRTEKRSRCRVPSGSGWKSTRLLSRTFLRRESIIIRNKRQENKKEKFFDENSICRSSPVECCRWLERTDSVCADRLLTTLYPWTNDEEVRKRGERDRKKESYYYGPWRHFADPHESIDSGGRWLKLAGEGRRYGLASIFPRTNPSGSPTAIIHSYVHWFVPPSPSIRIYIRSFIIIRWREMALLASTPLSGIIEAILGITIMDKQGSSSRWL